MPNMMILKMENYDEFSNTVKLTFMYENDIIGLINLQCKKKPVNFEAH